MKDPNHCYSELTRILSEGISDTTVKSAVLKFHETEKERILSFPASVKNHHCWPGGYVTHIYEVVDNIIVFLSNSYSESYGFTPEDAILSAYIHDLDKLWRYVIGGDPPSSAQINFAKSLGIQISDTETKDSISIKIDATKNKKPLDERKIPKHTYVDDQKFEDSALVMYYCGKAGIPVNLKVLNAVGLHHGGWAPLCKSYNFMPGSLACVLHAADLISAGVQNGE